MKKPLLRMLWCDSVAPLGKPVVPLVYWMLIASSKDSVAARAASSSRAVAGVAAPAVPRCLRELVPLGGADEDHLLQLGQDRPRTSSIIAR